MQRICSSTFVLVGRRAPPPRTHPPHVQFALSGLRLIKSTTHVCCGFDYLIYFLDIDFTLRLIDFVGVFSFTNLRVTYLIGEFAYIDKCS